MRIACSQSITSLVSLMLSFAACASDGSPDASSRDRPERGTEPAVMVSVIGLNPDERLTYVGAFRDVPSGEVDTSRMLEFGDAYYYAYDGSVFVWERESSIITRYEVDDELELTKGKTISFVTFGFKFGAELTFISKTRAYMNVAEQDQVIVWNPQTMEISGTFDAGLPRLEGMDVYPVPIGVSGDDMYWGLLASNYDALEVYAKNVLAIAPTNSDGPVELIEDDRCVPALGGYITAKGDIYLVGGADGDAYRAYNKKQDYPPTCIVRVKAGERRFDPDFFVNLLDATGAKAIPGTWRIDDQYVLARVWNPDAALPEAIDEYWSGERFISKRIDIQTGETMDFDSPAEGGFSSNIQDRVDGVTYFPLPKDDGSGDVAYRLKPTGVEEAFSIDGGAYWGMGRLR